MGAKWKFCRNSLMHLFNGERHIVQWCVTISGNVRVIWSWVGQLKWAEWIRWVTYKYNPNLRIRLSVCPCVTKRPRIMDICSMHRCMYQGQGFFSQIVLVRVGGGDPPPPPPIVVCQAPFWRWYKWWLSQCVCCCTSCLPKYANSLLGT